MPRTVTWTSTEQLVASARRRPRRHPASVCGLGGPNSIDDFVLRPVLDWRDANTDWNDDASDGTLEERLCWPSGGCQNWRHDVVALVTSGGALRERVRYTAYGIPVGMPHSFGWRDCDGDGDVDAADQSILLGAWGTATTKCDLNLDGTVDATDNAILLGQLGATAGFGRLSLSGNRFGYAGYASDPAINADWHARYRLLLSPIGRWGSRDFLGYVDGNSLYAYVGSSPLTWVDPLGLAGTGLEGGIAVCVPVVLFGFPVLVCVDFYTSQTTEPCVCCGGLAAQYVSTYCVALGVHAPWSRPPAGKLPGGGSLDGIFRKFLPGASPATPAFPMAGTAPGGGGVAPLFSPVVGFGPTGNCAPEGCQGEMCIGGSIGVSWLVSVGCELCYSSDGFSFECGLGRGGMGTGFAGKGCLTCVTPLTCNP